MDYCTALFLVLTLVTSTVLPIPVPGDRSTRIVNGEAVDISQVPYQASLRGSSSGAWTHICGGVIISPRAVLTAAHCFERGTTPSLYRIVVGTSFRAVGGRNHEVARVIVHPDYQDLVNDIAILGVSTAFRYSTTVAAVPMAPTGMELTEGTPALVSGYGTLYESGPPSDYLMIAEVYVIDQTSCIESYRSLYPVSTSMLCAGTSRPAKDACQGDSGGPLVAAGILVGLVSWGEGCASEAYPGVYTRVSAYTNWVEAGIKSLDTDLLEDTLRGKQKLLKGKLEIRVL